MATDLITLARAGDGRAFGELVEPHRRALHLHCYRILGSVQDAEDALQETLLAAWKGLGGFEERATIRTWLYRIATSRCLNSLRSTGRRPRSVSPMTAGDRPGPDVPEPTRLSEVLWLEPYPDSLLDEVTDRAPGPEARYEAREAVSLAFLTALQLLPPRQRAVLILRDVLGFHAAEVAWMVDSTEESVTSALKRARATLQRRTTPAGAQQPPPTPGSAVEQRLVEQLTRAFEAGDVPGIVALLTDDVWLNMPPLPLEFQGLELATQFLASVVAWQGPQPRLIPTRANGQPAFGIYVRDPHADVRHGVGLLVLGLAGRRICTMTCFTNSVLSHFGLPRTLPA